MVDDGGFDPDVPGVYEVTYSVTDSGGLTTQFTRTITVITPVPVPTDPAPQPEPPGKVPPVRPGLPSTGR